MLQVMRQKFKTLQWILWAVIASFVLLIFVGWGLGGLGTGGSGGPPDVAIDIDGHQVSRFDFLRELRSTEESYRRQLGEQADQLLQQFNLREQVKNSLVNRNVALREARRSGFDVTDAEVRDYILRTWVDDQGVFVGKEQIERAARRMGYSDDQFRAAIADQILHEKFSDVVKSGAVVTEAALKAEYLRRNDKLKVDHVYLDARKLAADAKPTEAEVEAFFAASGSRYERDERKARLVTFAVADHAARATVTEKDLRDAYDEQARIGLIGEQRRARHVLLKSDQAKGSPDLMQALLARAREVAAAARSGASFEDLAARSSEDAGSRDKGGDLGFFGRGQMVKPFEEAVFAMKPGEVSDPVLSDYGYHVIRLEEVRPGQSFEDARAKLEQGIRERKARDLAREAAAAAIAKHGAGGDLAKLAAEAGKAVVETAFLRVDAREGEIPGVDSRYLPSLARALFAVAEAGKIADEPVAVGPAFAVLQYAEKRGPVRPALGDVRKQVEDDYRLELGRVSARRKAAELGAALTKGASLAEAATSLGLEMKTSEPFARGGIIPGVPDSADAASSAQALDAGKLSAIDLPGGTIFLRPIEKFQFDPARFEAEKDGLRSELESRASSDVFGSLIRTLRQDLETRGLIRYLAPDLFVKEGEAAEVL